MPYPKIEIANYDGGSVYFILLHPVVKRRCYIDKCHFSSNALIGSKIANSLSLIFFTKHSPIAKRK